MNSKDYLIDRARLWDAERGELSPRPVGVWIREGRIAGIGRDANEAPPGVARIDASGRFLFPGLIDAHVHLELDPRLRSPAEQLARTPAAIEAEMARRARAMLFAGITTARDCGGGAFREHGLRARIDRGEALGPRLLVCGQPLTTPGGHCHFWGGEVAADADLDAVFARNLEHESDWIKVMATGGVFTPKSRARDTQFEYARLAKIVEKAARTGRPVAAHCHGTGGIADALRAGVRTIEHASFAGKQGFGVDLDPTLMNEIARASVWVSPTVNSGWGKRIVDAAGEPTDFFTRMSSCLGQQREAGVRFIASTDAGIPGVEHHDLVQGLAAFERFAGLTREAVLRSATVESARALGLENETGRIAVGLSADLLLLEENPLDDWEALIDPLAVMARGEIFDRDRRREISRSASDQRGI